MISKFINRGNEISLLEEEWKKENGRLIVLYGRRRIGKTRLLMEFTKDRKGVFYIAEDSSARIQINGLKNSIADFLGDSLLKTLEIKDWSQLFEYLAKNMPEERFYLIIDEFSYLIKSDKRILSVLQRLWDTIFSHSPIVMVLSGSMLGLMSEMVLSYASPLYGRRTRDIHLEELPLKHARKFLSLPVEEAMKLYFITGGVPEYLLKAAEYNSLSRFLEKELLNKTGYFYNEPYFIISQEFRELKTYFSILNAIAYGNTRPADIANFVGIEARRIYPYLENLIRLGFIERQTSILGSPKKGIYFIKDSLFDFWFNFVFRYKEEIEREIFSQKSGDMSGYYGKKFENFVRKEIFPHLLNYSKIGRWWHREEEIDIVAINEPGKDIAFFECKWSKLKGRDVERIIKELRRKAKYVKWGNNDRNEQFGVIARHIEDKKILREAGFLLYDMEDFERILK
ncbi:MAG TPA: ATP-binding protein [Euryarchaeota archaeon]|nr:archaeal ATPase [archaeon BMS3Bbin15]HDL15186.1 ATP-binding protein [Euryarchaeota archaeon]